ncbi:MAG: nitroreductase family protein [Thermoguttaceae bacterium]|nr:nitroreductase family protein [Thermoguttaceae bacterium]
MDLFSALKTRRSVREFNGERIPDDQIREIIECGTYAPSALNAQPWHFIVVDDRKLFPDLMKLHPYISSLRNASHAIILCADRDLEHAPGNWMLDCSACIENMLLAAHGLGYGAVWAGIYPQEDRMERFRKYFNFPKSVVAHSIMVVGCPANPLPVVTDRYKEEKVHRNRW